MSIAWGENLEVNRHKSILRQILNFKIFKTQHLNLFISEEDAEVTFNDPADKTWEEGGSNSQDSQGGLGPKAYTPQEDKDIVLFLMKTRKFGLVKGTDVWQSMAKRVKKPRSWQSLKNR